MKMKLFGSTAVLGLALCMGGCIATEDGGHVPGVPLVKDEVAGRYERTLAQVVDAARAVLAADVSARETVLTGGDDYEILCTVSPAKVDRFRVAAMAAKVAVTEIGTIEAGEGVRFLDESGNTLSLPSGAFSHF